MPNLKVVAGETDAHRLPASQRQRGDAGAAVARRARAQGDHARDRPRGACSNRWWARAARCCTPCAIPPSSAAPMTGAPRYAYDPVKAKQLLAEAGYPNGFEHRALCLSRPRPDRSDDRLSARRRHQGQSALHAARGRPRGTARRQGARWITGPGAPASTTSTATTSVFFGGNPDDVNRDGEVRDLLERGDTTDRSRHAQGGLRQGAGADRRSAPTRCPCSRCPSLSSPPRIWSSPSIRTRSRGSGR